MRIAVIASSQFAIPLLDYFLGSHEVTLISSPHAKPHDGHNTEQLMNFCDFGDHIKIRTHNVNKQVNNQSFDLLVGSEHWDCPVRKKLKIYASPNFQDPDREKPAIGKYSSQNIVSFGRIVLFAHIESIDSQSLTGQFNIDLSQLKDVVYKSLQMGDVHHHQKNHAKTYWNNKQSIFSKSIGFI